MAEKNKQQDISLSLVVKIQENEVNIGENSKICAAKRKIIKNLLIICFGFVILFIAYNGLSTLQSTLNQEQGIGVVSQAIVYAGFCISALLLPKYTIKKLGCKRTLLLSIIFYIPYIAANFYFTWLTMIPSAILVGLAAALLWSSQCTYFNECSVTYSNLCFNEIQGKKNISKNCHLTSCAQKKKCKVIETKLDNAQNLNVLRVEQSKKDEKANGDCETDIRAGGEKKTHDHKQSKKQTQLPTGIFDRNLKDNDLQQDKVFSGKSVDSEEYSKLVASTTARFFGLFGLLFRSSDIWSNLISYYILSDNSVLDNITDNGNCSCGAAFCNVESECFSHNLAEPTQQMRNILSGGSVILAFLAAILVFLFLDEIEKEKEPVEFSFSLAMATCKFARRKEALLLLPLSSYIGFQQGFYIGDFTKSYIACAWGVYHVGLVTICYGLTAGVCATLAGLAVKYVGRIPVMITGAAINAAVCIYLLLWNPLPEQPSKFFISATMWGASVGILWSQLRAFYGVIFKKDEEAAFAGFYLWDSIGYCAAFSYSNYICTYIKIYILLFVSTIGMVGYLKTESIHMRQQKMSSTES